MTYLYKDDDFRVMVPQGYWEIDNIKNDWHGFEIYTPVEGDISGYTDFPATTRESILENIVPRGNKLENGFKPR